MVFNDRVERTVAASAARRQNRDLTIERDELLQNQRRSAQVAPGVIDLSLAANHTLPFAVVAESARLQDGRHAAELAAAQHADPHVSSRGSGWSSTRCVCARRYSCSASRMSGYLFARIAAASSAALIAPERPIASVPTGTPAGICTMESSESI